MTGKTALQKIRETRGFSRREVATQSGVNLRTLQDYEQGHKSISSAKSETLYRLSVTLGCSMEQLLLEVPCESKTESKEKQQERLWNYYSSFQNLIKQQMLNSLQIYSSKYNVHGKVKTVMNKQQLVFCYRGEIHALDFDAKVTEQSLPWLEDAAVLMIDSFIDVFQFEGVMKLKEAGAGNEA